MLELATSNRFVTQPQHSDKTENVVVPFGLRTCFDCIALVTVRAARTTSVGTEL